MAQILQIFSPAIRAQPNPILVKTSMIVNRKNHRSYRKFWSMAYLNMVLVRGERIDFQKSLVQVFYSLGGHFSKKIPKGLLAIGGGVPSPSWVKVWSKLSECILGSSVFDQVLISNNLTYNNITILTDQITFCCVMKQRKWVCFVIFLSADDHG